MVDSEKKENNKKPKESTQEDKKWRQTAEEIEQQGPPVEIAPEIKKDVTPLPAEEHPAYGSSEGEFQKWEEAWSDWFISEMQRTGIDDPKEYAVYFKKNIQGKLGDRQTEVRNNVEMLSIKKKFAKKTKEEEISLAKRDAEEVYERKAPPEAKEKMVSQELQDLRKDFDGIIDFLKRLGSELKERDRDGFSPVMDIDYVDRLRGTTSELELVFNDGNVSAEKINQSVQKITAVIGEIGKAGQRSGVRENPKSLEKLSHFLNGTDEGCTRVINSLRRIDKQEVKNMLELVKRLQDKARVAGDFIARKRSASKEYFG